MFNKKSHSKFEGAQVFPTSNKYVMLKAHEAMIEEYFVDTDNTTNQEITFYLGQIIEEIGALTKSVVGVLEDGILTQAEKNDIKKSIKKAEESIIQLKSKLGSFD